VGSCVDLEDGEGVHIAYIALTQPEIQTRVLRTASRETAGIERVARQARAQIKIPCGCRRGKRGNPSWRGLLLRDSERPCEGILARISFPRGVDDPIPQPKDIDSSSSLPRDVARQGSPCISKPTEIRSSQTA
jgi:hypothetical protein